MDYSKTLTAPQIGKAGELRVASELILRGFNPAVFFFDEGTDIILSNGKKIGVKTSLGSSNDKKNYCWKYSFSIRTAQIMKSDYSKYVDFWICWCIQDNIFYIIPQKEIGQKLSIVVPTPPEKRTYKKHINKPSQSKYEKYRDAWEQLN